MLTLFLNLSNQVYVKFYSIFSNQTLTDLLTIKNYLLISVKSFELTPYYDFFLENIKYSFIFICIYFIVCYFIGIFLLVNDEESQELVIEGLFYLISLFFFIFFIVYFYSSCTKVISTLLSNLLIIFIFMSTGSDEGEAESLEDFHKSDIWGIDSGEDFYTNDEDHYDETWLLSLIKYLIPQLGERSSKFFPQMAFIFLAIFFSNIEGLIPGGGSDGSELLTNLYISTLSIFIICIVTKLRVSVFADKIFSAEGVPYVVNLSLCSIESVSWAARAFSLSIRLFSNTVSGHIMVKIISTKCWTYIFPIFYFNFKIFFGYILLSCIFFLEIFMAFLQSIVFVFLMTVYINEASNLGH